MSDVERIPGGSEQIIEVAIERLRDFRDHPFKVRADDSMTELLESIRKYGILNPLIVRPDPDGYYEIISGHRRKYAARELGYRKVPVIIRVMKQNEAVISMVDSNLHRENIRPSEKAHAYRMKYDAIKRKPGTGKCGREDHRPRGKRTVQILAEEYGESSKQVQRYLKLTELIPELLKKVDEEVLAISPAVELAFLTGEQQRWFLSAMEYSQSSPSLSQAQRIKKLGQQKKLSPEIMDEIMSEVKRDDITRVTFKTEQLYRFFPRDYTTDRMKREILGILKLWTEQQMQAKEENQACVK